MNIGFSWPSWLEHWNKHKNVVNKRRKLSFTYDPRPYYVIDRLTNIVKTSSMEIVEQSDNLWMNQMTFKSHGGYQVSFVFNMSKLRNTDNDCYALISPD